MIKQCIVAGMIGIAAANLAAETEYSPPKLDKYLEQALSDESARKVGKTVSLNDCLRLALDRNPLLLATKEGIIAAEENTGITNAANFPYLWFQTGYSRYQKFMALPTSLTRSTGMVKNGPEDDYLSKFTLSYTLFDSGERGAKLRASLAREGIAKEETEHIQSLIKLGVTNAFYDYVSSIYGREVAAGNLQRAEEHLKLARQRKEVGAVPAVDVLHMQVEVAQAKLALTRAESLIIILAGNLNIAIGLPTEVDLTVDTRLPEIIEPANTPVADYLDLAMKNRPELKSGLHWIGMQEAFAKQVRGSYGLKLRTDNYFGWHDVQFDHDNEEWAVGVTLEFPIFTGFAYKHQMNKAKSDLTSEEIRLKQTILSIRQEVWNSYTKVREAYETYRSTEAMFTDSRETMRISSERYAAGAGTMNDLLDSENLLLKAETLKVQTWLEYYQAQALLSWASGSM